MLCLAPLAGFKSTTCETTIVFVRPYWRAKHLNQLNQLHDYTAGEANHAEFCLG